MALTKCSECDNSVSTEAVACPHCGAPQGGGKALVTAPSVRLESLVVSIGPDYENAKINEMAGFGWALKSRQEVIGHLREAESPDNLGAAIFRGAMEGATGTQTVTYDQYVKLHFARDMGLPNIEAIRTLEKEYFGLSFPELPKLFPGGFFLVLFWYPLWPLWYFFGYKPKKAAAAAELVAVAARRKDIVTTAAGLI